MVRVRDENEFEELEPYEYPDEDPEGEDDRAPCPHCQKLIYDDTECCPFCGHYVSREDAPRRQPWWVVLGAVLCLSVVIWWIILG